jgi:hypothetical protein
MKPVAESRTGMRFGQKFGPVDLEEILTRQKNNIFDVYAFYDTAFDLPCYWQPKLRSCLIVCALPTKIVADLQRESWHRSI